MNGRSEHLPPALRWITGSIGGTGDGGLGSPRCAAPFSRASAWQHRHLAAWRCAFLWRNIETLYPGNANLTLLGKAEEASRRLASLTVGVMAGGVLAE